jgi:cell division protein FtsI/penicillin-binding protein 2
MTEVLQNSINTGVVWLSEKIGPVNFKRSIDKFGFGEKVGIELNTESGGVIPTLAERYTANAAYTSFGQSITATPLQLAVAYGAIAHNGIMMRPMIVREQRRRDGTVIQTQPQVIDRIISERAAKVLTGMLTVTLDSYKKTARLEHYYAAAKTGTAQIATNDGYLVGPTNHTLVGFGPSADPRVVVVVKYGEVHASSSYRWAESTTGPVFKDVMKTIFDYYQLPAER